jgi:hypothetical protein
MFTASRRADASCILVTWYIVGVNNVEKLLRQYTRRVCKQTPNAKLIDFIISRISESAYGRLYQTRSLQEVRTRVQVSLPISDYDIT